MSLKYEIIKKIVRMSGLKNKGTMSADKIIALKKKQNAATGIPVLKDPEITVRKGSVMGSLVLCMIHNSGSEKAMLYIIGGGMVRKPSPNSVRQALKLSRETGIDVFIPYYPLCTDHPLTEAYKMIHETYRKIQKRYGSKNTIILGTSSGANLALGIVPYINENGLKTPMPDYIMALSPGVCPETDEEKKRVQELDKKDVAVSAAYLTTAEEIMRHGSDDLPDYMIHLQNADFTDCPAVTLIYGTDEVLYAMAPSFEKTMKKYNVNCELIAGQGMFHCYPVFPIVKEAQEGWKMMIGMLRKWKISKVNNCDIY